MKNSITENINETDFKFTGEDSIYGGEYDIGHLQKSYETMIDSLNIESDAVKQAVLYTALYLTTAKRFEIDSIKAIIPTRETTPDAVVTYALIDLLDEKFRKARTQYHLNETKLTIDNNFYEDKFEDSQLNEMFENDEFPKIDYEKVKKHFNLKSIECVVTHNGDETTIKVKKW